MMFKVLVKDEVEWLVNIVVRREDIRGVDLVKFMIFVVSEIRVLKYGGEKEDYWLFKESVLWKKIFKSE